MRVLFFIIGILIFSGCSPKYNTNCDTGCFSSDRHGKVYQTGKYYTDCGCQKKSWFGKKECNCTRVYRYVGPTTSCGADGMCVEDEF